MKNTPITLTDLNIRQSISILLAKLTLIDFLAAFLILFFYFSILEGTELLNFTLNNPVVFLVVFGVSGLFKVIMTSYVILLWLNEYYEITPDTVVHKSGIIFKKKEEYNLEKVRAMSIQNNIIGELFNFATITLYDLRMQKYLDMYLIHNPHRYIHVIRTLRPDIEIKTEDIIPIIGKGGD